jgi:hypothetical protein
LGYLGIEKLHANSQVPHKESKNHTLTKGEKAYNKRLARQRVVIEHINCGVHGHRFNFSLPIFFERSLSRNVTSQSC